MPDTTHDALVQAAEGLDANLAYWLAYRTNLDAAQNGYDVLAGNLRGVVAGEMFWQVTYDPTDGQADNLNGGVFDSLSTLFNAMPRGAHVDISITGGTTVDMVGDLTNLRGIHARFVSSGAGRGTLNFPSYVAVTGNNGHRLLNLLHGASVVFDGVDITLEGKADGATDWGTPYAGAVRAPSGSHLNVAMVDVTVTGTDGAFALNNFLGSSIRISARDLTLDGSMTLVGYGAEGTVTLGHSNTTLLNGAALVDAGTVGVNQLISA